MSPIPSVQNARQDSKHCGAIGAIREGREAFDPLDIVLLPGCGAVRELSPHRPARNGVNARRVYDPRIGAPLSAAMPGDGGAMDMTPFSDQLLPGERVLWSGRAGAGIILAPKDVFLIPFSLIWCGFAVFWEVNVSRTHAPGFFLAWGAIFVAVGLYFVVGRFLLDAWIRRSMTYALTDRRVLIARAKPLGDFTAISLENLADISIKQFASGRGTIRFGPTNWNIGLRGPSFWVPALDPTAQFIAISDASSVFDMIQRSGVPRAEGVAARARPSY